MTEHIFEELLEYCRGNKKLLKKLLNDLMTMLEDNWGNL